jgi:hypothetical protein
MNLILFSMHFFVFDDPTEEDASGFGELYV